MATYLDTLRQVMGAVKFIDLSYTMEAGMPAWPTHARYASAVYESYNYGDAAFHCQVVLSEHSGTHIDAPKHFIPGGAPVDALAPDAVMGRCVHVNATALAPCAAFSFEALQAFEAQYGDIAAGDIVLFRFGWDEKYAPQPNSAPFLAQWPGLSGEAARYLLAKGVKAVGTDAMSLDAFDAPDNVCHHVLLGAGVPILENVSNLANLPVHAFLIGLPNKFAGGSGSPIRLVALVESL